MPVRHVLEPREALSDLIKIVKTGSLLRERHRKLMRKSPLHMKGLLFYRRPKISPPLQAAISKENKG